MTKLTWLELLGLAIILTGLILSSSLAAEKPERYYQQQWCDMVNGTAEVTLADRTRVDCLTRYHAIEFDFGRKWAEAIGQALGYADMTGKLPGIVLILETPADRKYWAKLQKVVGNQCLKITLWCTGAACEVKL